MGQNLDDLQGVQAAKKKGIVDVVFLIDTTGSMGPVIQSIADNIATFVNNIDRSKIKDIRMKVCSFGDLDVDRPEVSLILDREWTDEPQKIVEQLNECIEIVKEGGGGDEPESSLDAIYSVINRGLFEAPWNERTRVIVLFTDATPKPIKSDIIGAELSKDDALNKLSQEIAENHIHLFIWAPKHPDYEFIAGNNSDYVTYYSLNSSNPVEELKNLQFDKVMETLGKSISQQSI